MRTEVRRMVRSEIAPALGLAVADKGDVLHRRPIAWILSGYVFEWSAIDTFYLTAFAQHLWTPAGTWVLTVSERIPIPGRRGKMWGTAHEEDLVSAMSTGLSVVDSIGSLTGHLDYLRNQADPKKANPRVQEAIVYGAFLESGDLPDRSLQDLLLLAARYPDSAGSRAVIERATLMRDRLVQGIPVLPLLQEWRESTLAALKVTGDPPPA
jgi:hypothetical protein